MCCVVGKALGLVIMPLLLWGVSRLVGAVLFLAVALTAAVFGYLSSVQHAEPDLTELLESVADFLSYVVWYLAGQFLVEAFSTGFRWEWVVVAFMTLVPLRICTVVISLLYSGLDWRSQVHQSRIAPLASRSTNPAPRCAMSLCRCSLDGSDRAVWPRSCSY
jgi:hypothetical protein